MRNPDLFIVSVIERGEERYTCIATPEQAEDLKIAAGHYGVEVAVRRPNAVGTALQWMAGRRQRCLISRSERSWSILVCRNCGSALGETRAAIRLGICPDCGLQVVPVEERCERVHVFSEARPLRGYLEAVGEEGQR